jgi:4-hydroxy-4-methyl-2-oxoglutarate aldolase
VKTATTRITSDDGRTIIRVAEPAQLDAALVERARNVETAALSDADPACMTLDPGIRSFSPGHRLVGTALTVALIPGDNLLLHVAIRLLQPGDVLVVDTGGATPWTGPFGDMMRTSAAAMGGAGAVIDGYIRDPTSFADGAFPVFARGATPRACDKRGGGTVNDTVRCGGVTVDPGDVIVADDNGIIVIPRAQFHDAIAGAEQKLAAEAKRRNAIAAGAISPGFLDTSLHALGLDDLTATPQWKAVEGRSNT